MEFTRALMFPFDDEDWLKKLGLGVLISLIPVVGGITLQGWAFEISKRVKRSDPTPLPDWSDFGGLLKQGFMLFLANLIYQIPTLLFACLSGFVWLLPMMGAGNEDVMAALGGLASIVVICCSCLIALYALAAAVVYWGAYIRYIDNPEFGTFFQIGENFAIVKDNIGDFGMALLYTILAGAISGIVSGTVIGGLLVTAFLSYFTGHILGQLAAKVSKPSTPQV
jgi:hypothetical protein